MPATKVMKGAGYYDRDSAAQRSSIQALLDWVDDAVANLPLPDRPQAVTVLDLGSSKGGNADAFIGLLWAISEPVVRAALNQTTRETATVDSLYERVRARLLAEPERYAWRYIIVAALLTRR
jgi:hypothetical protein